MLLDDGFQIGEVTPLDDGSLITKLLDQAGNQVGSVTRLPDGTTQADVPQVQTDTGGYDWTNVLHKVVGFLDQTAGTARGVADQATRISRGIQGASAGAKAGYNAPINWLPYAIAGGAVLAAVAVIVSSSNGRSARQ